MPSPPRASAIDWPRFSRLLADKHRILLTTHVRPDGDALGSVLGMAAVLRRTGREPVIVGDFDVPPRLAFLDPDRQVLRLDHGVTREEIDRFDLILVLDTCAWGQLGAMADILRATRVPKAVIDHHISGDDLGAVVFKDAAAEAAGRLVVAAADALGVALDAQIARPLLAALATDTGWFRFSSATAETYRLAARLIDAGAEPDVLYRALYEHDSLARLHLAGRTIGRAETELAGRLIYTWILREDFEATGALPSDSEDLINATLAVGGTEAALLFIESAPGLFRVSFRSRSAVDVRALAEQFGGGGHTRAAGATVEGPWPAVRTRVLDAVRRAMQ